MSNRRTEPSKSHASGRVTEHRSLALTSTGVVVAENPHPGELRLWEILSKPERASALAVRLSCGLIAAGLVAIALLLVSGGARWGLLAAALYAAVGAVLGPSLPDTGHRAYAVGLVMVTALATAYASGAAGHTPAAVAVAGAAVLGAVLCLHTGPDFVLVDVALPGSWAAVLLAGAEPGIGRLSVLLIWVGALSCGNAAGLALLVYRTWTKRGRVMLREARELIDETRQARLDFMRRTAREIRDRLTGAEFGTEQLLGTELSKEQREHVAEIRAAHKHVTDWLDDLADGIDRDHMTLDALPFDLHETINDVLNRIGRRAQEQGLDFVWEFPDEVPSKLVGDPRRVAQVFQHIVGNAIKFTDEGSVSVRVSNGPWRAREAVIKVEVEDTGRGIEPSKHKKIVEMLSCTDAAVAARYRSAGIGLPLCADIVRLMNGELRFESVPGKGSTFTFTLSLRRQTERPPPRLEQVTPVPLSRDTSGLRILLAEDNAMIRKVVVRLLQPAGHTLVTVENGKEALAALDGAEFDLVLMDVEMPVMDGLVALAAIRAREDTAQLPVIALTGHAFVGDRERLLAAGMDAYVPKPVRRDEMFKAIETVLARGNRGRAPSAAEAEAADPAPGASSSWPWGTRPPGQPGHSGPTSRPGGPAGGPDVTGVIDLEVIRDQIGDDHEQLQELIVDFRKQRHEITNEIKEKLGQGEMAQAAASAHKFKGSLLAFGASHAADAATRVELAARENNAHVARTALQDLESEATRLDRALSDLLIRPRA